LEAVSHIWVDVAHIWVVCLTGLRVSPKLQNVFPVVFQSSRLRHWAAFVLFLAGFSASAAADPQWFTRVWNTDDGLLNDQVDAIVQSQDNYLWVVPPVGLMRFDGVRFSRFPLEDFTSPTDNHISAVLCSRTGILWAATLGGTLLGFRPDFSTIKIPRTSLPKSRLFALAEDKDGVLWIEYANEICRVNGDRVTTFRAQEGVPSGAFHSLISDGAGNIWLAKGNQLALFRKDRFQRMATAPGMRCVAAMSAGGVWVAAGTHLWSCATNGPLRDVAAIPGLSGATEAALLEDHMGAVWIGTGDNGLIRYSKSGFEKVETSYPSILGLGEDREGDLWVATDGGGLDRISLRAVHLEALENKPVVEQVQCICQDAGGRLWGTAHNDWQEEGLLVSRVDGKWIQVFTNAPFAGTVTCVAADTNGTLWLGTQDGTLLHSAGTNAPTPVQNTLHGAINALLPASNGDLWIASYGTLQRRHDGRLQEVKLPRKIRKISAITEDAIGNIWVASYDIVLRFDGTKFMDESSRLGIAGRRVSCLYGTPDGSMWISGGGIGLLRVKNGKTGKIAEQGLFDDYISQIVADSRGWLWFGADHGIFRIREQDLDQAIENPRFNLRPVVYGRNEGLSSLAALFSTGVPFAFPRAPCAQATAGSGSSLTRESWWRTPNFCRRIPRRHPSC
jgi:ligand-binding sensor domain-containing protein